MAPGKGRMKQGPSRPAALVSTLLPGWMADGPCWPPPEEALWVNSDGDSSLQAYTRSLFSAPSLRTCPPRHGPLRPGTRPYGATTGRALPTPTNLTEEQVTLILPQDARPSGNFNYA